MPGVEVGRSAVVRRRDPRQERARRAGRADRRRPRAPTASASRSPTAASSWSARAQVVAGVKVALLTREYPPEVYGGAGVHVEYLARELARARRRDGARVGRRSATAGRARLPAWDALAGDAPQLAALRAMSIDLAMAAGRRGRARSCTRTPGTRSSAGHLAKLIYDIPHVATVHSLEPLRPWKAEQLGGGYALSSWCERSALEGADAVIAVSRGIARRTSSRPIRTIDPARVTVIYNGIDAEEYTPDPGTEVLEQLRRGSRPAVGRVRRADHAPEGRAVPARGGAAVRSGRAARAVRGRAGHAGDRRRGRGSASSGCEPSAGT